MPEKPALMTTSLFVAVAICGAAGTLVRFTVSRWMSDWGLQFPLATFCVNIAGCFLLGICFFAAQDALPLSPLAKTAITSGFLGALTTFSTFKVETMDRMTSGQSGVALMNIACNIGFGLFAVWIGRNVAFWLNGN